MRTAGIFNGAGAAIYIGLGYIPDWANVQNVEAADFGRLIWSKFMASQATIPEGVRSRDNTYSAGDALAAGAGISPYYGGDLIAAASDAYVVPADSVFAYQGDMRSKGTAGTLNQWTLDTAANRTGKFNAECNTTYVGVGSRILIDGKWYTIHGLTSNGEADDEVTLDRAAPSGAIEKIEYMLDFVNAPAGIVMPPGIKVSETAHVNVNDEHCLVEAGTYDN